MGLLLYKSSEMYSSTELIRKSKMIFTKILDKKIDKAIILRDGKPSFLLMEFRKYEKIMAEFEELKEYVASTKEDTTPAVKKTKVKNKVSKKDKLKKELLEEQNRIRIEADDYTKTQLETKNTDIEIENDTPENEKLIKNIEQDDIEDVVEKELSQEDEIKNALKSIESMNFDDEMKKAAEEKIKEKILQQRKIRAEQLALKSENSDEEEQEELEIEQNIEEEKIKKERELKEFWD